MVHLSKRNNIKSFLNYCKAKYLNPLLINKNEDIIKETSILKNNNLYSRKESNVFIEILKSSFIKFRGQKINEEINNHNNIINNSSHNNNHNIYHDTNKKKKKQYEEKHNVFHTENMHKEVLLCMDVLQYEEDKVNRELHLLHSYFNKERTNIDPYTLCESKIKNIDEYIYNIIKTNYKNIDEFITYIYLYKGKRFRVILSILLKNILHHIDNVSKIKTNFKNRNIQRKFFKSNKLTSNYLSNKLKLYNLKITQKKNICEKTVLDNQCKIIAASEIIHMGSLLHDDVIDDSNKRRGVIALHKKFGNKISILSGDYLLARASSIFAGTGSPKICRSFSYVVESLIKGEFLQRNLKFNNVEEALKMYLIKSYHKTASLFSHLFACIAILSFKNDTIIQLCFNLGLHIGMAFQLYDDYLDYKIDDNTNKPILNDLKNNIKTAPLLFSYNYNPQVILQLINKNSYTNNDIENILYYIQHSNSMKKNELCSLLHIKKASDILYSLISHCNKPSTNKNNTKHDDIKQSSEALINLILNVLSRNVK